MKKDAIAILCAGGPAPGINTVIGSVTKVFLNAGYTVLGIQEGYKTLFTDEPKFEELDFNFADTIFSRGGSALKMSRYKPKDSEFTTTFFTENNIKLLVTSEAMILPQQQTAGKNSLPRIMLKYQISMYQKRLITICPFRKAAPHLVINRRKRKAYGWLLPSMRMPVPVVTGSSFPLWDVKQVIWHLVLELHVICL
jgi:hypothetical protein